MSAAGKSFEGGKRMKVILAEDIKGNVADEIMLRLLETDFKVEDLDAHIEAVRQKFPQLSARDVEQIGVDNKLFPAQEVAGFRASQAGSQVQVKTDVPAAGMASLQSGNNDDHSGPH